MAETASELVREVAGDRPQRRSARHKEDVTGRDRMTHNVLASWAGHLVFVVAGFVLPRMIDERVGQAALGVWDFGWSVVTYFGLMSGGILSSIGPYVARHRAAADERELNATVNTALGLYLFTGTLVFLATLLVSALLPLLFNDQRLAGHVTEAQWVVFLLGLSVVAQFFFAVFNGIITGCHRWGVHNAITSGVYLATSTAIVVALLLGGGLVTMAALTLAGDILSGVLRVVAAHRFCPGLRLHPGLFSLRRARELFSFGVKSMMDSVSYLAMYQTNSMLIVYFLGAPALAVYSRPMALVRHTRTFICKFAYVLTPTAGALEARGDRTTLQDLLVTGTRYGLYLALPMATFVAVMGGPVLHVWMGPEYDLPVVAAVLAVGHMAVHSQLGTYQILMGLGRHGWPAMATLIGSLFAVLLALFCLGPMKMGLLGAALAVTVPLTVVWALLVPAYACRAVGLPYRAYVRRTVPGPLLSIVPLLGVLAGIRYLWSGQPVRALLIGIAGAVFVMTPIYWLYVAPPGLRTKLAGRFRRCR